MGLTSSTSDQYRIRHTYGEFPESLAISATLDGATASELSEDIAYLVGPDSTQRIIPGEICMLNPSKYLEKIGEASDSPFYLTKCPIEMWKITIYSDNVYCIPQSLTQLIIPSGTQMHIDQKEPGIDNPKRMSEAIVGNQYKSGMFFNSLIIYTESYFRRSHDSNGNYRWRPDTSFIYETGRMVRPENPFDGYDEWIESNKLDQTCASGIHGFWLQTSAKNYDKILNHGFGLHPSVENYD